MKKVILLLAVLALSLGTLGCGGGGAGSSASPGGENPGIPSVVQLSPSHIIAQTNASITLHAKVLDGNGAPIANVPVTFTNLSEPLGVISATLKLLGISKPIGILSATVANTDGNGIATVSLRSTTPGFVTVQAEVNAGVGTVRQTKTMFFASVFPFPAAPAPPPPTLTLDVDDGNGIFNQPDDFLLFKTATDNQRTIRATVRNGSGNPVMNATVTFGSDSTEVTFPLGKTPITDVHGQASVLIQVDPSALRNLKTVVNITASTTVDGQSAFNLVTLTLSPVTISTGLSSVTANPTIVNVNETSSVTATVILNTGGPAPDGTSVNFTTAPKTGADPSPCGSITPFSQLTGGVTTPPATFTAPPTPGICTVTARTGGVTIGTVDITITSPPLPLSVQPGKQSISGATGGTATFTIFGGLPGYTVTSANSAIAFNGSAGHGTWSVASSGDTFVVTVPAGAASGDLALTVRDSAGTTVAATLTISPPNALVITPKTASVTSSGSAQTLTFTISGGIPGATGYITTSSDPSKAFNDNGAAAGHAGNGVLDADESGIWTGTPITVTFPANVAAGSVTLNVFDSVGATTSATITIIGPSPIALQISPKLVSVVSSASITPVTFTISGGTPGASGYVTTSSDSSKAFDTAAGDGIWAGSAVVVHFAPNAAAGSVTLNVLDSVGATTTATITIIGPPAAGTLFISPQVVSVVSSASITPVVFAISGGTGPYVTTSSDPSKVFDSGAGDGIWNVASVTANFAPNAAAGSVTLNVLDSVGGTASATITILASAGNAFNLNPAAISVTGLSTAADSVTFTITGGTANYVMSSSNTAVVPNVVVPAGGPPRTFTVDPNPVAASTAVTITVVDSTGATDTSVLTVTPPSSSLAINPSTIAVDTGTTMTFTIIGGVGPFTVYTSDSSIALLSSNPITVTPPTVTFSATAGAAGSATITVVDNAGKTVTAAVTVNAPVVVAPDFAVSCAPISLPNPSAARTTSCTVTSLNGFSAAVALSCAGLPGGGTVTCDSFAPASPVTPPANLSTSTVLTMSNAGLGTGAYSFLIVGTSGALTHTPSVILTVP